MRFSSKTPVSGQPAKTAELSGRNRLPISGNSSAPLEIPPPAIQRKTTKSLTGSVSSDVLNAYQRMSDWRRLGIKNEEEGFGLIPLTQGKFAIVDAEDYDRLSKYKWCAAKDGETFYAHRACNGTTVSMHREIMRAPKGVICDHKNHNGLDNRKSNLQLCTSAQNQYNKKAKKGCSSRYKGVILRSDCKRWRARISYNRKRIHLGDFDDQMEAAMAYDDKAVELFGEFAWLNFPERIELNKWIRKIIWAA